MLNRYQKSGLYGTVKILHPTTGGNDPVRIFGMQAIFVLVCRFYYSKEYYLRARYL